MKGPNSIRHLDDAIREALRGAPQDFVGAHRDGERDRGEHAPRREVVKGRQRAQDAFGEENTRFTTDGTPPRRPIRSLRRPARLRGSAPAGEGFSGRVVEKGPGLARWDPRAVRHAAVRHRQAGLPPGNPGARCRSRSYNEIGDADAQTGPSFGGRRLLSSDGVPRARQGLPSCRSTTRSPRSSTPSRPGRSGPRSPSTCS